MLFRYLKRLSLAANAIIQAAKVQLRSVKRLTLITAVIVLAGVFSSITLALLKPTVETGVLLEDMMSSYSFQEETYLFNKPALKARLRNWANHLHQTTQQPVCLSSRFVNYLGGSEVNMSACSEGTTLSDLAKESNESGFVNIMMGDNNLGEIEWLSRSTFYNSLFIETVLIQLVPIALICAIGWWLYVPQKKEVEFTTNGRELDANEVYRSLFRVMGYNRRAMALHDNWVHVETASHPNLMFRNLDGSVLRIRASLSDIKIIFPGAVRISRSAMVNTAIGVHRIEGNHIFMKYQREEVCYRIDKNYLEGILNSDFGLSLDS